MNKKLLLFTICYILCYVFGMSVVFNHTKDLTEKLTEKRILNELEDQILTQEKFDTIFNHGRNLGHDQMLEQMANSCLTSELFTIQLNNSPKMGPYRCINPKF